MIENSINPNINPVSQGHVWGVLRVTPDQSHVPYVWSLYSSWWVPTQSARWSECKRSLNQKSIPHSIRFVSIFLLGEPGRDTIISLYKRSVHYRGHCSQLKALTSMSIARALAWVSLAYRTHVTHYTLRRLSKVSSFTQLLTWLRSGDSNEVGLPS